MPKMKTHRGAAKRFKKTGTGKIVRASAFKRHILTSKTTKSKRQMRGTREELGLSPSALSRRILSLEEFVGRKLFTRAHQTMQLTDDGRSFYDAVAPHIEALASAASAQEIRSPTGPRRRRHPPAHARPLRAPRSRYCCFLRLSWIDLWTS